jgi:predicted helicase
MTTLNLKPTHAPVKAYYEALERFGRGNFDNEGNIRGAFERLLEHCARKVEWTVIPEYKIARKGQHPVRVDAGLIDAFNLPRGYWEAKDSKDNLEAEIHKKFEAGYPRTNILFQSPARAVLYQGGRIAFDGDITTPEKLVDALRLLFEYREPQIEEWEDAVSKFSSQIPQIAAGAMKLIEAERKTNKAFIERFTAFADVCRESINPDLKDDAVEKMLVQHLLTERIFRRIFDNPEFTRRNVIAVEIEKVIDSLTEKHFSRDQFLQPLNHFYKAIEDAASQTTSYAEKQSFLNVVYEKFFQRFDAKQADTHGIVYTPQPIVDFMVRSVEEVLKQEFGRSLSDEGVHILDPFVGTGTFITRIMQEIRKTRIEKKYATELHCNEVMLLPYYVASMNIEHAFHDITGHYEPFEGICLVDTFELAEPKQAGFEFMTEGNTERIRRQKRAPIFVVIGNPPYNMGQVNENDQNKNRKYRHIDGRVHETYTQASTATLRNKLSDPYVKAFRWATDRIRPGGGVVAYVSNDSFVDQIAFDGMRKHLLQDFDKIYVLDLGGNVRKNPKLSGTTHNVFGIQVGVAITLLIRNPDHQSARQGSLHYATVGEDWKKEQKYDQLHEWQDYQNVGWRKLEADQKNNWLTEGQQEDYASLVPLGNKASKGRESTSAMFRLFSLGVAANRDAWVYAESAGALADNVSILLAYYEDTRLRRRKGDDNIPVDNKRIKWTDRLIEAWLDDRPLVFDENLVRRAAYRPFNRKYLYFDHLLNQRRYQQHHFFPTAACEAENLAICSNASPPTAGYYCLAANAIPDLHFVGDSQCFPFYSYAVDGSHRRENITDWALTEFRSHYGDSSISKWDIFHYTYGLLHHPEYRTRYAANLKRELPRIPFAPDLGTFAKIGKELMAMHIGYEKQPEYPLERTEVGQLDWKVEKMTLSKDKSKLRYNKFLTLCGIPPSVYEYRLGNRSALEWIVDQYRVSKDPRSGIVNDPNKEDDPEYIVRLIGQVITVSLETVKLVRELATLQLLPDSLE